MNERALWEHVNDERDGNWKLTFVSLGVFAIFLQIPICNKSAMFRWLANFFEAVWGLQSWNFD